MMLERCAILIEHSFLSPSHSHMNWDWDLSIRFEKIYVWMDDDVPGRAGCEKFIK